MKNLIKRVTPFDEKKKCVNVVLETPKGSQVKYAYDPDTDLFALKKALPEGMMFPFNFGFIPGTKGGDGDPLDVLILNQEPLVPGCLIKVRLIGVIKAEQAEKGKTSRNGTNRTLVCTALSFEGGLSITNTNNTRIEGLSFVFVGTNTTSGGTISTTERITYGSTNQITSWSLVGQFQYAVSASGTNAAEICRGTLVAGSPLLRDRDDDDDHDGKSDDDDDDHDDDVGGNNGSNGNHGRGNNGHSKNHSNNGNGQH